MAKATDPQLYESGYERKRLDRYWTAPWMTSELFRLLDDKYSGAIPLLIWECAAGRGDMSRAIAEHGRTVYSTDIDMSEFDETIGTGHERSFLDEFEVPIVTGGRVAQAIITNPPYNVPRGIADAFIRHGLSFMENDNVTFMAMLLRSEFRSGKSRKDMFGECPHYMGELVLTTRPRWDYGDPDAPEKAAPRTPFSWFLWRKDWQLDRDSVQFFSYMPKGFKP